MTQQPRGNADRLQVRDGLQAAISQHKGSEEAFFAKGRYEAWLVGPDEYRRDEFDHLSEMIKLGGDTAVIKALKRRRQAITIEKWRASIDNLLTSAGRILLFDNCPLAASNYSSVGPYLGLISSVSYTTGPAIGDTMSSHTGWYEAGNGSYYPNWSTPASNARQTCAFSGASGTTTVTKALSAAVGFTFATNGGTVNGCFIVLGTNAVSTNASTAGTLFSAGVFSGSPTYKEVAINDQLNVSWQISA